MIKNKITTIGGAANDIMFYTDETVLIENKKDLLRQKLIGVEYGAKIYSDKVYLTYGGGGMNTAVNLAGLGIKTQTIISIGDDFVGKDILKYLKDKRVSTKLLQVHKGSSTGTSFVLNVGKYNEHVIFVSRGANKKINLSPKVVKKINTSWLYLASLSGSWQTGVKNIFEHATKKKIRVAWNPGSEQLKAGLKKLATYIKQTNVFIVNRDEALELVMSVKGKGTKDNINLLLKFIHSYGPKLTVITDGKHGAYIYDGHKVYFRASFKKKGVNTTGAGDAFGSSLVAGIIKYRGDLERSLKLAIINSNSVIMKVGAQEGLLKANDLKKYNL